MGKNKDEQLAPDEFDSLTNSDSEITVPTGFKKSFMGGFKKKDVLDFINSLIAENNKIQDSLQSDLDTQVSTCSDLSSKIELLQSQSESTKSELDDTKESLNKALESVKTLQTNLSSKNNELNLKTKLIAEQSHRLEVKVAELNTTTKEKEALRERVDELEVKEERLNKLRSEIGQLFVEAKSNAANIIKQAKAENVQVKKETNDIAISVSKELVNVKDSLGQLKQQLAQTLTTMENQIDELDNTVEKAAARIEKFTNADFTVEHVEPKNSSTTFFEPQKPASGESIPTKLSKFFR